MLNRLKKTFYWKNFVKYEDKTDKDGFLQGLAPVYSETLSARANVSANIGSADMELFGHLLEYDRVIVTKQTDIELNENSIVWLDGKQPPEPHNYIVVRKSVSNNVVTFALKRVEVGTNENQG